MGRPGSELRFGCQSVDPEDDELSYQFSWGDGNSGDWSAWQAAGREYFEGHVFADTGVFRVTCRARDEKHETGWGDSISVRIEDFGPFVPRRPSGPDTVAVGDTVSFFGSADHPLGERVALQFDWGDILSDWSAFQAPGSIVKMRHAFWRGGFFGVRARARDSLEHVSGWSKPDSVLVVDTFGFRN